MPFRTISALSDSKDELFVFNTLADPSGISLNNFIIAQRNTFGLKDNYLFHVSRECANYAADECREYISYLERQSVLWGFVVSNSVSRKNVGTILHPNWLYTFNIDIQFDINKMIKATSDNVFDFFEKAHSDVIQEGNSIGKNMLKQKIVSDISDYLEKDQGREFLLFNHNVQEFDVFIFSDHVTIEFHRTPICKRDFKYSEYDLKELPNKDYMKGFFVAIVTYFKGAHELPAHDCSVFGVPASHPYALGYKIYSIDTHANNNDELKDWY